MLRKIKRFIVQRFISLNREVGKTSERLIPQFYNTNIAEKILFLKHQFAYEFSKKYIDSNIKILDYGCGDGYGSNILAQFSSDSKITGVDVDENTIKSAKKKYKRKNLEFLPVEKIKSRSNEFDLIVSFQVMEHVSDTNEYLNFLKDKLNDNGTLIISTPSRDYRLNENQNPWNEFHLREYNMTSFQEEICSVFDNVIFYSLSAIPEVLRIEFDRVKYNRKDKSMFRSDNFDSTKRIETNYTYTTNDFFLTEKEEEKNNGLDLFCVVKK